MSRRTSLDPPLGYSISENAPFNNPSPPDSPHRLTDLFKGPDSDAGPIPFDKSRVRVIGSSGVTNGKPSLKFLADESTALAGKVGLALVGKFSHTIPSPHIIDKALGNINLVGALTWKFFECESYSYYSLAHS